MVNEQDRDKLVAFVHGELDQIEVQRLTARFQIESDLRLEYEALLASNDALEDLFLTPAKEDLSREQVAKILNQPGRGAKPAKWRMLYMGSGAAIAASIALLLLIKQNVPQENFAPSAPKAALDASTPLQQTVAEKKMRTQQDSAPPMANEPSASYGLAKRMDSNESGRAGAAPPAKAARVKTETAIAANQIGGLTKEKAKKKAGMAEESDGAASDLMAIAPSRAEEPAEWFACTTSPDCILVEDFCHWRAINKEFAKAFQEAPRTTSYECKTPRPDPGTKSKFTAICKNSRCILEN